MEMLVQEEAEAVPVVTLMLVQETAVQLKAVQLEMVLLQV